MWELWVIEIAKVIFVWAVLETVYGDQAPAWESGGFCSQDGGC